MPPYYHPGLRLARVRVHDGAPARARRVPARARRAVEDDRVTPPADDVIDQLLAGTGEKVQAIDHDRVHAAAAQPAAGSRASARASCRSSPTRRARSASTRCSASSRSTRRSASTYEPVDAGLLLSYREASDGRILEEGITEAGAMASFTAAGTAYATWGQPMIPFFIFYSMFGFQRVGDLIWAFGDQRGPRLPARRHRRPHHAHRRGTAALRRPEPAARVGVPELPRRTTRRSRTRSAVHRPRRHRAHVRRRARGLLLLPHALQRELRAAADARRRRGGHRARPLPVPRRADGERTHRAQILASGTADARARSRRSRCSPTTTTSRADVWSATELQAAARRRARRASAGTGCTRPSRRARRTSPSSSATAEGPVVAVTDFVKAVPDQIAPVRARSRSSPLGTDGYGFSDTRAALRRHFEVDAAAHRGRGARTGWRRPDDDQGRGGRRGDPPLRHRPRQRPTPASPSRQRTSRSTPPRAYPDHVPRPRRRRTRSSPTCRRSVGPLQRRQIVDHRQLLGVTYRRRRSSAE